MIGPYFRKSLEEAAKEAAERQSSSMQALLRQAFYDGVQFGMKHGQTINREMEADNARLVGANLALQEKLSRCVCHDCGGRGGKSPNGVEYCNCDDPA